MTIADKAVLVTGANRGIGRALVEEALRRGAKRVYAGTRQSLDPPGWARHAPDPGRDQRRADSGSCRERRVSRHPHQQRRRGALRRLERSGCTRTAPRRQPLRHVRRDPGLPAVADSFSGSHRQRPVAVGLCLRAGPPGLLDLEGGRVLPVAVAARAPGRTGRAGSRRHDRSRGHRHDPRPRHTEGLSGVRRASHLRRSGERGGGDLPRSDVGVHGGELAQRRGQGVRAPECGAPRKKCRSRREQRSGTRCSFGMRR